MKIKLGNLNAPDAQLQKQLGLSRAQVAKIRAHMKPKEDRHGDGAAASRSR